jgi:hypothetical protein
MAAENGCPGEWLEAAAKIRLLEAAFDGMDADEHQGFLAPSNNVLDQAENASKLASKANSELPCSLEAADQYTYHPFHPPTQPPTAAVGSARS